MRAVLDHPVHSLDFVKVTESAALAASRWMGRGERDAADGAAVEKMREALGDMEITGRIVIGEGERDEAPMLYIGEEVGTGGKEVDIAVDPVEGTNLVANGLPNSIAVMAIAERGGLLHAPDTYMKKLAVGAKAAPYVHIDAPVRENVEAVANALEKPINDVCVIILDRPRHADQPSSDATPTGSGDYGGSSAELSGSCASGAACGARISKGRSKCCGDAVVKLRLAAKKVKRSAAAAIK